MSDAAPTEGTPQVVGHDDTSQEHLAEVATTDAALELPPEQSGFGEGVVGEVLLSIENLSKSFGSVRATTALAHAVALVLTGTCGTPGGM